MKKLLSLFLISIAMLLCSIGVEAAAIWEQYAPVSFDYSGTIWGCRTTPPYCAPHQRFWNRTHTKIIGEYQPLYPAIYPWADMNLWRIGNASQGLTTADWQDIEDAKVKSGGYWRWGICWPGSHPATICLN